LLTSAEIIFKNKLILLMMTAVVCHCVFSLSWA